MVFLVLLSWYWIYAIYVFGNFVLSIMILTTNMFEKQQVNSGSVVICILTALVVLCSGVFQIHAMALW